MSSGLQTFFSPLLTMFSFRDFCFLSRLRSVFFFRNGNERKLDFELKEDDIVRVATRMLPLVNLIIAKTKEIFSGEPSMTLKVNIQLIYSHSS